MERGFGWVGGGSGVGGGWAKGKVPSEKGKCPW
jgi:hypothetical protein